jgi:hypothetical protein
MEDKSGLIFLGIIIVLGVIQMVAFDYPVGNRIPVDELRPGIPAQEAVPPEITNMKSMTCDQARRAFLVAWDDTDPWSSGIVRVWHNNERHYFLWFEVDGERFVQTNITNNECIAAEEFDTFFGAPLVKYLQWPELGVKVNPDVELTAEEWGEYMRT